ncbi:hypothetical protein CB0940_00705 [Cercospora beticola]|uniref:Uncharacterized protein n=1 Tax=Cercospora beticola TaxID=122368 RepID=A0A2G5ICI8_CERBT|nr:hypothetical protein CB0940_00705 [Cercospora beticola]PIB02244.1 hypothetical protein CB0940_00705 [Cercospora beticola]WPA96132.1 hypothetical protein RHO25_000738 [Cercospora beticola]
MSVTEVLVSHTNVSIATWPTDELPLATSTGPIPLTHTRGSRDPNVRRSQVCQLYTSTMEDIAQAIGRVKADAHDRPAAIPRTALTASVRSSVYQVNEILRYGPMVGGAELAWKVALHLASCTIAANYSDLDFTGQEQHCDKHHDRLDRRLSSICDLQQKCGKVYWLSAERLDEVERLKHEADAPYRYPLTTAVLARFV